MVFASFSGGGIAGTPSSRVNFIDCLLMEYEDFLSSWSLTKWRGGVMRLLEIFIKTNSGLLVGKSELYEPSTSFDSGQVQPVHVRFGVVHLVHS